MAGLRPPASAGTVVIGRNGPRAGDSSAMARFDVYPNPAASERRHTPFLLDVQNDYVDALGTRVVIALRKVATFGPQARNLNPVVAVADEEVVLDTAAIAAVPARLLRKPIANLRDDRGRIQEALDTLFGNF